MFSVLLIAFSATIVFSQKVSGGLRVGMNIANQKISASGLSVSGDSKIGVLLGGYLTVMVSEKIGIQPEVCYSSLGASFNAPGQNASFSYNY